jgi:hypothetical protein
MPDFTETAVVARFAPMRAPTRSNTWPPAIRPAEREPAIEPLLDTLGTILSEFENSDSAAIPEGLIDDTVLEELQTVVAQFGAARLLRLVDWLSSVVPDQSRLVARLANGKSGHAQAIRSSLRALTVRDTITRMFSIERVAELQSCAETALKPTETF